MTLFNRRQARFLNHLKETDNSIINYYNIKNPNLLITFKPFDGFYEINIVYDRKQDIFEFPMLPYELNKYINDYTNCYINITLNVSNVDNFPFYPPIWSLKEIMYNIQYGVHINIKEYYEYLINLHNDKVKVWSPCMQNINSDLLNFIMIANTFEHLEYI